MIAYKYTGTAKEYIDANGKWCLSFESSGVLTVLEEMQIDVWLQNPGQSGGACTNNYQSNINYVGLGKGGDGGRRLTRRGLILKKNTEYTITIGAASRARNIFQAEGSTTMALGLSAADGTFSKGGPGGYNGAPGQRGEDGDYAFGDPQQGPDAGIRYGSAGGGSGWTNWNNTTSRGSAGPGGDGGNDGGGPGGDGYVFGISAGADATVKGSGGGSAGYSGGNNTCGLGADGLAMIRQAKPGKGAFEISVSEAKGYTVSVEKINAAEGHKGLMADGWIAYTGDTLRVIFSPRAGYRLTESSINGVSVQSDTEYTVTGPVDIRAVAVPMAPASTVSLKGRKETVMTPGADNFFEAAFDNPHGLPLTARVVTDTEILIENIEFTDKLTFLCPADWFKGREGTRAQLTAQVSIPDGAAEAVILPVSFLLLFTGRPTLAAGAVTEEIINPAGSIEGIGFAAGISFGRINIDPSKADLSGTQGATLSKVELFKAAEGASLIKAVSTTEKSSYDTEILTSRTVYELRFTDSRGAAAAEQVIFEPLSYVAPSLTGCDAARCDKSGADNPAGVWYKIKAAATFSSMNGKNKIKIWASIKAGAGDYGPETELTGFESGIWSDKWAAPSSLGGGLAGKKHTVRLRIKDGLMQESAVSILMTGQYYLLASNETGTAMGIGMIPEANEVLDLPAGWRIRIGGVDIMELLKGKQEEGS